MRSEQDEMAQGLRLAAIAVVSAIVTATLVIGGGQTLIHQRTAGSDVPAADPALLVRTSN